MQWMNAIRWSAMLVIGSGPWVTTAPAGADDPERVRLQHDPRQILEAVARQMNVTLREDEPLPAIHLESLTPIARFQDAVAPQWKFRPTKFVNVYVVARNEIYLADGAGYYRSFDRSLDDSLAHEFAHYLQARYQVENVDDDAAEQQAIKVQFAFRAARQAGAAMRALS